MWQLEFPQKPLYIDSMFPLFNDVMICLRPQPQTTTFNYRFYSLLEKPKYKDYTVKFHSFSDVTVFLFVTLYHFFGENNSGVLYD